jgi:transcription termination/antitermination protein NusG
MKYFALQVMTRAEGKCLKLLKHNLKVAGLSEAETGSIYWPRRTLMIRRRGKTREVQAPIYPGYLFLEAESVEPDVYWVCKRTSGVFKFLKDNRHIEPLCGDDERILKHFLAFGEVTEKSKVYFDTDKKIKVLSGPMKGLEGRIIKVDKRKRRAKIKLSLYQDSFVVDFAFEHMEPVDDDER